MFSHSDVCPEISFVLSGNALTQADSIPPDVSSVARANSRYGSVNIAVNPSISAICCAAMAEGITKSLETGITSDVKALHSFDVSNITGFGAPNNIAIIRRELAEDGAALVRAICARAGERVS